MRMLIGVIVPVYKVEPYLRRCGRTGDENLRQEFKRCRRDFLPRQPAAADVVSFRGRKA